MVVTIDSVRTTADRRAFVEVPRAVRSLSSPWVRPLNRVALEQIDPLRNPYFSLAQVALFLARRGSTLVGRIAAHLDPRYALLHEDVGLFGFFDAADDEAALALLDAAQAFVGSRGLLGPFSFTAVQDMGLMTAGHENPPGFTMCHHPPSYAAFLTRAGFRPTLWMETSFGELITDPHSLIEDRHRQALKDLGAVVRTSSRRGLVADLETVRELMNSAFLHQPHFVPATPEEWAYEMLPGAPYFDPHLLLFIEIRGVPIATLFAIPDFNPILRRLEGNIWNMAAFDFFRSPPSGRLVILVAANHPAYQGMGLGRILYADLAHVARQRGYRWAFGTWIVRGNIANQRQVEALRLRPCHELAIFERAR